MSQPAILVENLSKRYQIGSAVSRHRTIREALTATVTGPLRRLRQGHGSVESGDCVWALKDISFHLQPGEVVGIIGRNGAGKSTLLKVLSRITEPTAGRVRVRGRVASLLEVGTGFHTELTGRENIFLNGSILGMSRSQILERFDDIVAFADVERFIDTPVKRYSSGMYLRLAFAVAAHLETDILVVDEVLAVGDAAFQQKCMNKMGDVTRQGRTVLFVSHNMASIEALCSKALVLKAGRVDFAGMVQEAIRHYVNPDPCELVNLQEREDRSGNGKARAVGVRVYDRNGNESDSILMGEEFCVEIRTLGRVPNAYITIAFGTMYWKNVVRASTWEQVGPNIALADENVIRCHFTNFPLMHGSYDIHVRLEDWADTLDYIENVAQIAVYPRDVFDTGRLPESGGALTYCQADWEVNGSRYA